MTPIRLSPSTLNLFLDCPHCFWLEKAKNIKRPRGIFPSLPSGMDREIKNHLDLYRAKKILPPELENHAEFQGVALFADQQKLEDWRNWRTGLAYSDAQLNAHLGGAIDDLLVKGDRYIPFDYKTKGSPTTTEDAIRYYQNQMDCYAMLLEANGMTTAGFAFLFYYSPKSVAENGRVLFEQQIIKVPTDPTRAMQTFRRAVTLIRAAAPKSSPTCEYCAWFLRGKAELV